MKKTLCFAFLAALLASCGQGSGVSSSAPSSPETISSAASSPSSSEKEAGEPISVLSPTGAPTLAFYDQGTNENWESTANPSPTIPTAFASASYDAIVFDGLTGLSLIAKQNRPYRLARFLSGGTFYLVSTKHEAGESVVGKPSVDAFVANGTASTVFRDLAKSKWGWGEYAASEDEAVTYETGVEKVRDNLLNLAAKEDGYDYYLLAEPVVTVAKAALAKKGIALNVVYSLQEEFAALHEGAEIPAAALFVNNASYGSKKGAMDEWLAEIDARVASVAQGEEKVFAALAAYEEAGNSLATRFGFPSSAIVKSLQQGGANKLHYYADASLDWRSMANRFQTAIGSEANYLEGYFLS